MERKSSKNLRHKTAVSEYLKFQSLQQKHETLEKISSISSKMLPRPGEFLVCSSTLHSSSSRTMTLADFNKTGLLRPNSSSLLRQTSYQDLPESRPSTAAILTTQLRNITKPQIPEMLTLSSIAMSEDSRDLLIRPSSGIIKTIDWKRARNHEKRPNSHTEAKPFPPRPATSQVKPTDRRIVIKKGFNVKKQNPGPGFSVTTPIENFIQEAREELGRTENTKFLPLEMYNPHDDQLTPSMFIEKIRKEHGEAVVYSKWFFADGTYEWKKCRIIEFDVKVDRYLIEWENLSRKHASRINIRLLEETEDSFQQRLEVAGKFRDHAEVIMKYTFYIESMTSPTTEMPLKMIDCIINRVFLTKKILPKEFRVILHFRTLPADEQHSTSRMLWKCDITHMVYEAAIYLNLGYPTLKAFKENYFKSLKRFELKFEGSSGVVSSNRLSALIGEVEKNFEFAQHKLEFEADLPYNLEKQELFSEILSKEKFVPLQERVIVIPKKVLEYEGFVRNLEWVNEHLHQANADYFAILYAQNVQALAFNRFRLFLTEFPEIFKLSTFVVKQKLESIDTIKEFKNMCFDTQYSIQDILNVANEARQKRNEDRTKARIYANQVIILENKLQPAFLDKLGRFLKLCNRVLEREMRMCIENSLAFLNSQLRDLWIKVKNLGGVLETINHFNWNRRLKSDICIKTFLVFHGSKVGIEPGCEEIVEGFKEFIWDSLREVKKLQSLELHEIGNSREEGFMQIVDLTDEGITSSIEGVCRSIEKLWRRSEDLVLELEDLEYIMHIDVAFYEAMLANDFNIDYIAQELQKLKIAEEIVSKLFGNHSTVTLGLFIVKVQKAREAFQKQHSILFSFFQEALTKRASEEVALIEEQEKEIINIIRHIPKNLEELNDIKIFLASHLRERLDYLDDHTRFGFECIETMEDFQIKADSKLINRAWRSFGLGQRIEKVKAQCHVTIKRCEKDFAEQLKSNLTQIVIDIENIRTEFNNLKQESNVEKFEETSQAFGILKDTIEKTSEMCRVLNIREGIVGVKSTDFKHLESIKKEFLNYFKLWFYLREFSYHEPHWLEGNLSDIESESVSSEIELYINELRVMQNSVFKEVPSALIVVTELQRRISAFSPYVPLLKSLKSLGLKDRHWENISNLTSIPITKHLNLSLRSLIDQGILNFDEEIEEIAETAAREQNLESAKQRMEREWDTVTLKISPFKNSSTFILVNTHEIWDKLDEHLMKVISMCNSPYAEFMEKEINYWKNSLFKLQEILDEWEKLQKTWSYFYPIFLSADIVNDLPVVAGKFAMVNSQWEIIMNAVRHNPVMTELCWGNPKLLDQIKYSRDTLETILKSLYDYLNTKRKAFPRFYFLSNEELLTILSNSREIETVQRFVSKCFEGVNRLILENDLIMGLESPEQERIMFADPIEIKAEEQLKNVEVWMKAVEGAMKSTLRSLSAGCTSSFVSSADLSWLSAWPSQLTQCALQLAFTSQAETFITSTTSLPSDLSSELSSLVSLTHESTSENLFSTISTLIILTIHNRDVVSGLVSRRVRSVDDFYWQAEMRYYQDSQKVRIRMVDTVKDYGYEYLGNQGRLVITPLTDRCQRILMIALRLNLGGAPEGPAGTGKTETTKDLAKALAKKCIVFNCSDSLDHTAMAKFFIGLCSCGAWACFDEFNRMEQEVLSVIAEQIATIQNALTKGAKKFQFEEELVGMDDSCAIFITMNPGYAGRSELPENLKALFRPIAMMVPDYTMIAEIFLYSFGFQQARVLAKKLVTSFKLASEQLSSQKHYDYGLRSVNSVIRKAGIIKRAAPGDEEQQLLKAIKEITLPKYLPEDIPLLLGILSDLFPPAPEGSSTSRILPYIESALSDLNLISNSNLISKTIELFELIEVRHGNMIVGEAMSGKSSILELLSRAYGHYYYNTHSEASSPRVDRVWINPKSMTLEQLYGKADEITNDWIDGVLSYHVRQFSEQHQARPQWMVLDGPVDALWIENLNTVLDDNKKLCLSSGEIIKMTKQMRLLFEVEDLEHASPATVSRCGMVYLHSTTLNWRVLKDRWVQNLPAGYNVLEFVEMLDKLFEYFIDPCLKFFEKINTVVEFKALWMVKNVITLMEALMLKSSNNIQEHNQEVIEVRDKITAEKMSNFKREPTLKEIVTKNFMRRSTRKVTRRQTIISEFKVDDRVVGRTEKTELLSFFLFSLAWGGGGFLEDHNKRAFNEVIQKVYSNSLGKGTGAVALELSKKLGPIYHNDTFFSHFYNPDISGWESWNTLINRHPKEKVTDLNFLLVPCIEIVSKMYILSKLVPKGYSVLIAGSTGTGKSSIAKRVIENLDFQRYSFISSTLSAQSSCNMMQELIETKLTKRKKNVYGGAIGKRCVVLIDDLNMPMKEEYGAQPTIEILRSAIDQKTWYDLVTLETKHLEDLIYLGAMGSGGGREKITLRYMRHLFLITASEYCAESLELIYKNYLSAALESHSQRIIDTIAQITSATIELYQSVLARLPPTPAKSHYTFNLRDISRVFQGIAMVKASNLENSMKMYQLWVHECLRVFSDRLIGQDQLLFVTLLSKSMEKWIHLNLSEFITEKDLMYCNFINDKCYQECSDMAQAKQCLEIALEEYNSKAANKLEIVFFDFAVIHLARICRIISTANGHMLLVGSGGNGRRSLCKMAAFLQEYNTFELQVSNTYGLSEWREDIKSLLLKAGAQNSKELFIFKDYEVTKDIYFENVNNLLNSGEVPNLFNQEEKDNILDKIRELRGMSIKTGAERWEVFLQNTKRNLHIVMCMSPVGDNLKQRLRQFPSFTNCCSIDWMSEWPEDALRSVTEKSFKESGITSDLIKQQDMQNICVVFHYTVLQAAENYKNSLKILNNITSSHYLLFLQYIRKLMDYKKGQLIKTRKRYKEGVKKIENTQIYVDEIRQDLIKLKPILEERTKDTEEIMKIIHTKNVEADKTRTLVSQEQQESAIQAEVAAKIKQECEEKLNKAIPDLENAIKALKTLKKDEINEVRNMQKPPHPVKLAVEAVVIINKEKPMKVSDPQDKSIITLDYFEAGKKMMKDPHFIQKLQRFDKDSLNQDTIDKLLPYIENPKFEPEMVKKASVAAEGLCKWVRAMYNYYYVNKDVKPKQESLKLATETMADKLKLLQDKEFQLKAVEEMILELKGQYESKNQEKQKLIQEIKKCELHMTRAVKLIEKLKGEKERWGKIVVQMKEDMKNLIGDIILAAGMLAYMGNFIAGYREKILQGSWIPAVSSSRTVTCSENFWLKKILSDELQLQTWNMQNLPTDKGSVENAIMLTHSLKYPLFVDPQNQAFKWISRMKQQEKMQLVVIKPGFEEFYAVVENSMFLGNCLWIENTPEALDPMLIPLLNKSFKKHQSSLSVKFGDSYKQIDPKFQLYMSTTIPNPNFPPETSTKVNILNFTITQEGLTEQLLAMVCKKELPKETDERNKLVHQSFVLISKLQEFEDTILRMLQIAGDNILDDEVLINSLTESKTMAEETEKKLQSAQVAEQRILDLQANYIQVSRLSAVLYFAVSDLQVIDPVYLFSMEWFLVIFTRGINKAQPSKVLQQRIENLIVTFRDELYTSISMCLFEKDKLLLSFLIAVRLANDWNPPQWRYLLTGMTSSSIKADNPDKLRIQEKTWKAICEVSHITELSSLASDVSSNLTQWVEFMNLSHEYPETPHFHEFCQSIPTTYQGKSNLEKLLLIKAIKPEAFIISVQALVKTTLGEQFLRPQQFSIRQSFNESDPLMPLIFVLTPGSDPQSIVKNFASDLGISCYSVSLGKGQGDKASRVLKEFAVNGGWVLLQNCHLMPSWMPELENILQRLRSDNEKGLIRMHAGFRLWLTTKSTSSFPITILQHAVKIINESAKGLKNHLKSTFASLASTPEGKEYLFGANKTEEWQRLLFGLCFFHCQVIERQKYGSLAWNVKYEFSLGDLRVSQKQLKILVENSHNPPFEALLYLTGECNYGGRVTDSADRLTLNSLLLNIYCDDIMYRHYRFSGLESYKIPERLTDLSNLLDFIDTFPSEDSPLLFGLHTNASISYSREIGQNLLQSLVKIEAKSSSATISEKQEMFKLFEEILSYLLPEFSISDINKKYPILYSESLNTFLQQEVQKFNTLTRLISQSLSRLRKAIDGHIVITHELEALTDCIIKNKVPAAWSHVSYLSAKPLMSWLQDLNRRLKFFSGWIENGYPKVYWISGFFFPQSFLTSLLQNYARANKIPIDGLQFSIEVLEKADGIKIQTGCLIDGLFLEGARWDAEKGCIEEAKERVLYDIMPIIWLKPVGLDYVTPRKSRIYNCPVYRTAVRAGVLSSTGHSTNYVMSLPLQSNAEEKHWVQRGVAILTQLND